MRRYSITRRAVLVVLLLEFVFAVSTTALVFFYERHSFFGALDIALRGHADSLMGTVVEAADDTDSVMMDVAGVATPKDDRYEVWEKDTLLGRHGDVTESRPELRHGDNGFFRLRLKGRRYRMVRVHAVRVIDPNSANVRHDLVVLYAAPMDGVFHAVDRAVRFFAIANSIILLVTGLLIFLLLRRSMAPLDQLAAEASTIAANHWRFSPSEEARSVKELEPLVVALEGVVGRLERSFGQQRIFISDAAHELKTAVAVVKSSIQVLSMKERTGAEYQAGLERCQSDCDRMEDLVQRMLLLATVEEGELTEQAAASALLSELMTEVIGELEPVARLRNVRVKIMYATAGEPAVAVLADRGKTIFTELILNAIQHSPEQEFVTVTVTFLERAARVVIHNGGEDLPAETIPYLFERFYRGDPSRARATGGTGLGLAICKALVEQAGGTIAVRSRLGVELTVELPTLSSQPGTA